MYDDLASRIQSDWGYMVGRYPLWVGEFGTCNTADTCVSSTSGSDLGLWFSAFTRYLEYHNVNWSYWALNGTKSDGAPGQGITYGQPESYGLLNTSWDASSLTSLQDAISAIQPTCPSGPIASGTYFITNVHSKDVIDIPQGNTTQGTDLEQWPKNGNTNQQWKVTSLGCDLYEITSVLDGQSIDISGQSTSSGARVDEYGYWGGGNQQFIITGDSTSGYTISSINSMDPIEVPGFSTTAGTLLDQWSNNGGSNQHWTFSPA